MARPRKKVLVTDVRETITEKELITEINKQKAKLNSTDSTDAPSLPAENEPQVEQTKDHAPKEQVEKDQSNNNVVVNINVDEVLQKATEQKETTIALLSAELKDKSTALDDLKSQYETDVATLKQELDSIKNTFSAREQTLAQQLEEKTKDLQTLEGLIKLSGVKEKEVEEVKDSRFPMINKLGSDTPKGAAKDFIEIAQDKNLTPAKLWIDPATGEKFVRKDFRNLDRFVMDNKVSLRRDLESLGRAHGMFNGGGGISLDATAGQTSGSSVPEAFLDFLSSMMRTTHSPKYVFWQFVTQMLDLGQGPGNTILVPRMAYLDDPTSVSDFELGNDTTYTAVSASDQALVQTSVSITLKEYGLGKGGGTATRPVAIPEFISARSMIDLERGVQRNLSHNYYAFEDLAIRSLFANTTVTYYNVGNAIVTAPANGGGGTMTKQFLNNLYANLYASAVLPYPNGRYVGVLNPIAAAQLRDSLDDSWLVNSEEETRAMTEMLMANGAGDMERVQNYIGSYNGFDFFVSNAFGVGASGEGVEENDTVDGGNSDNIIFRDSYFFGPGVVGRGIGMPVEIRVDNSGTFGRNNRYIWLSHEGFGLLDCDSALGSGQQTRCVRVRTADKAI